MTRTAKAPRHRPPAALTGGPPPLPVAAIGRNLAAPPGALSARMFVGRSLFPLLALGLIAGTVLWGPWVTLALAVASWAAVGRFG